MRTQIFQAIGWIAARHLAHYEAVKILTARLFSFGLKIANPKLFEYHSSVGEQFQELQELKALNGALAIKDLARSDGGWEDHHGIGLNMVAAVLVEQHGWHPEDVNEWVDNLTDGFFNYSDQDFDD